MKNIRDKMKIVLSVRYHDCEGYIQVGYMEYFILDNYLFEIDYNNSSSKFTNLREKFILDLNQEVRAVRRGAIIEL